METPTAEDLARFDRKRKGKTLSNADWKSPTDPDARIAKMDARIAKMKDGTTHLAYKLEHAVDLDTGVVAAASRSIRPTKAMRRRFCRRWTPPRATSTRSDWRRARMRPASSSPTRGITRATT